MRMWSISPAYLDQKGLTATWRESLLAQKVLQGKTKGYKNHPQLLRFKNCEYPLRAIGSYLTEIWNEAKIRGYNFDASKIEHFMRFPLEKINVTEDQLVYEFKHLQRKLETRCPQTFRDNEYVKEIKPHSLFNVVEGCIESWEKIS